MNISAWSRPTALRLLGGVLATACAAVAWTIETVAPVKTPALEQVRLATGRHDAACAILASPAAVATLGRDAGRDLQQRLRAVYRADAGLPITDARGGMPLGDGVIGPVTLAWLQRFCLEFAVPDRAPEAPGLVDAVHDFATILDAHVRHRQILLSTELGRWIASLPALERTRYTTARLFGTDEDVVQLLQAFEMQGQPAVPREIDEKAVYYELTTADLAALAAPRKALDGIAKLKDKPPLNADAFDATIIALLEAAGLPAADFLPTVRRHAEPRATHQITAEAIQALKVRRLPPAAIALAQSVQDLPFPERAELAAALEDAIRAGADAAPKGAPKPPPAEATKSATPDNAPEAAEGPTPPAATAAAQAPPAEPAAPRPAPTPNLTPFVKEIVKAAVERVSFQVTDATVRALETDRDFGALPVFLVNVLRTMENVEYPTDALYRAAVNAKIVDAFLKTGKPPGFDKTLKTMAEIEASTPPPAYLAAVKEIGRTPHTSSRHVRDALAGKLETLTLPHLPAIEAKAYKSHDFSQDKVSVWNGGNCGCVLEDRLPGGGSTLGGRTNAGIVYGLFPVWQTGHEQLIDFSVLSSIGYYAVPFDDSGALRDPLAGLQEDEHRLDFVDTAHRHGVRVDWIVRRVDWTSWNGMDADKREKAFETLSGNIATMLQESGGHWLRRLASTLSMGGVPAPHRGDGVTLYFDGYPEDDASIKAFMTFHQKLHDRLRMSVGEQYSVNLLFPASTIGTGIHQCENLVALMYGPGSTAPTNSGKFLVFISEPSIDSKKDLRQTIENCATGKRRKDLQQNIVPIIQYDGYSEDQLTDDVVYFDFNFGGVGLWPHPVASDMPAAVVGNKRVTVEQIGGDIRGILLGDRTQGGVVHNGVDRICTFVCPNRWVFRGLFEAFLAILVVSLAVRMINCRLNFALKARPAYFYLYMGGLVAPTLLLFLSLLYCDPAWADIREGNIPFLLLAVGFIGFVIWLYIDARRQAAKP